MQKITLVTTLATELDNPTDTDILSLLGDFLDEAIETIAVRFKWQYLNILKELQLVNGNSTLNVNGVVDIEKITRKDTEDIVHKTTRSWLQERGIDFEDSGFPNWWFVDSFDQDTQAFIIGFDQIADANYDLLITCKKELGGIADNDHIPYPINMLHIIKHYIRSLWYLNEENVANADRYEAKFERNLRSYIQNYGQLSAERVYSPQNSDLSFVRANTGYDINLDKDRIITEI